MTGMADQVESDNGAQGASLTYDQQLAADRAAFLGDDFAADENDDGGSKVEKQAEKKPAKPAADDDSDLDGDGEEAVEDETEVTADDEETDEPSDEDEDADLDEDEPAAKAKVDPETAKRLAAVRRTEERAREQITRERQKLETERAAFETSTKERLEKLERFEKLASRARYSPVEVLTELGLTEDDFEEAAREIYAHSKKASADPKLKEAAARSRRERELADEVRSVKAKLEEREKTEAQQRLEAEKRQGVQAYVAKIAKSAPDTLPLAKSYIAKNPEKAHAKIEAIANRIANETGAIPKERAVLVELEKDRRRALRDLGIDPKALSKTLTLKGDPKKTVNGSDAKKAKTEGTAPAKTNGKPLTFEEQKRLDREAFINADDEDDN